MGSKPYRRVALIVLYDKRGRILLQHRPETMERLPNYWAYFGGGIDEGETPYDAVIRETKEELDYDLSSPQLVYENPFKGIEHDGYQYVFIEAYDPAQKLTLLEGDAMKWFNVDEVKKLKIADMDLDIVSYLATNYSEIIY